MKFERRHGVFVLSALGTAFVAAVLSQGNVAAQDPSFVPNAVRADWEGIDYPALERVVSLRAAEARAKATLKLASR
jgi:hypothetical protein